MSVTRVQLVGNVSTGASFVGVVTATSFSGNGSGLTGVGIGSTGSINTSGIITASSFVGALTGTLTNATGLPISGLTSSTSTALGVGSIELGHATDTTLSRSAAGVLAVEGVVIPSISSTDTLTNKTLTSPTLTTPALGTPTSGILSSCTVDGTNKVGFLNIPLSGTKTASYTLVAGDVGKFIELGTSGTVVVPASVFAAGDAISIFNNTSASISCTCSAITDFYKGGTDTDISTFSVTTRGVATILFITATRAVVTGNLA